MSEPEVAEVVKEPEERNNRHFAKCPYCGREDRDSWELGDDGENECGSCEKTYHYEREMVAYFYTKGVTQK